MSAGVPEAHVVTMGEIDIAPVLVLLIAVAAAVFSMAGAMHLAARRGEGLFQYFPYAVLLSLGVLILLSGRSFALSDEAQSVTLPQSNPIFSWTSRMASFFLVLASVERIARYTLRRDGSGTAPTALLLAFVIFWSSTVASPALFGAHGSLSHEYLYTLLMGGAALLLSQRESAAAVAAARNGLMVFLAIGVALIPLRPGLVMDFNYTEGLLPGVPRFAGLSPHPVSLGMLAQLALLCLYAQPLPQRWLNRLCWALALATLFLAQSKTSWLSFPVCVACMFWMRRDFTAWHRVGLLAILFITVGLGMTYMFGNPGLRMDSFLPGQQGADLASLSGRARIWAVALREWARHPAFGFGTDLFDDAHRASIGMPFAFNAHNQVIDTLARAGLVGVTGLALYTTILLTLSVKYAWASRGLSLALFLAIALRSVSEVPLGLFGYGVEAMQHLLLLSVLAGESQARSAAAQSISGRVSAPATRPGGTS